MTGPVCESNPSLCGTLSGYQSGGRCYRCRRANADKSAWERGRSLTRDQRNAVIAMVNGGAAFDVAVREVGASTAAAMYAARGDGELRCALEGRPRDVQQRARIGDYLAALLRCGGDSVAARTETGMTEDMLYQLRHRDPQFRALDDLVRAYAGTPRKTRNRVPDMVIDRAAQMIAQGVSINEAARQLGVANSTLYHRRQAHPELDAAMRGAGH